MRIFYGSFASNVDDFFDAIFSAGNRQKVTLAHTRRSLKSTFISPAHNFTNTMTLSHNFTKKMIHFHDFTNKMIYPHNFTKKVLHSHNFTKKMTHSHNFTNTMTHSHSFTNTVTHSHNFNKLDKPWQKGTLHRSNGSTLSYSKARWHTHDASSYLPSVQVLNRHTNIPSNIFCLCCSCCPYCPYFGRSVIFIHNGYISQFCGWVLLQIKGTVDTWTIPLPLSPDHPTEDITYTHVGEEGG